MKYALLLFTAHSITSGQAKPDRLKTILEEASNSSLHVDIATYDQLLFSLATDKVTVQVPALHKNLKDYDVIYQRRINENAAESMAVGNYALHNDIPVMDEDMARRPGSMNKLTQYMQFALQDVPIPISLYASNHKLLLEAAESTFGDKPFIAKSIEGTRGGDNHLVASLHELEELLAANPDVPYILQEFIPNSFDYRVWVCGDQIGPILQRSRASGHLNNTSQGGSATLFATKNFPAKALKVCIEANQILLRDVSGVDVIFANDDLTKEFYILEANRAPQIEGTPYEELKAEALAAYLLKKASKY